MTDFVEKGMKLLGVYCIKVCYLVFYPLKDNNHNPLKTKAIHLNESSGESDI